MTAGSSDLRNSAGGQSGFGFEHPLNERNSGQAARMGEREMQLEEVLRVHVTTGKIVELQNETGDSVVMIPFTGKVSGNYFQGEVLDGGVDTQIIGKHGDRHHLSARYMLQGKDYMGQPCQIYIENNGEVHNHPKHQALFRTTPKIITNSKALSFLNEEILVGEGFPTDCGVDIKIYRWV